MNTELEELREKCRKLQNDVTCLKHDLEEERNQLRLVQKNLARKTDISTMYEHILDERGKQLDDMTEYHEADTAKIAALNATVDTLAERIAELKNGKQ